MGWRNPLFQKKRGGRRTGRRTAGHWSELLLSVSLVVVGGLALAVHIFQVLVPDVRESRELRGFERGTCVVTDTRIVERNTPLGVAEFGLEIQASRLIDEGPLPPVWLEREFGDFSPSRDDAEHLARLYAPGTEQPCWYDPDDPDRLVMRRSLPWWPWPVTLIPASLLAVGVWGIVASLMQVTASAERRSMVTVRAARLDPLRDSAAEVPTAQSADSNVESPGAHYAYRLPMLGTAAWRMAGLMLVCAIWNALLAYFGYVATQQYLRGDPPWLALGLVVVLGLVGLWLAFHLVQELWDRRGIGPTQLEISDHPLSPGGEYRGYLVQTGRMQLALFTLELVCEESASYQQGTDSRTSTETVYRQELRKWRRIGIEPQQPFEAEFTFNIPASAMHSFRSAHNEVRWLLSIRGETERKQEFCRQFALSVCPACVPADSTSDSNAEPAGMEQSA